MRTFLRWSASIVAIILLPVIAVAVWVGSSLASSATSTVGDVEFERRLNIPPLAEPVLSEDGFREFVLRMQTGKTDLGHGPATQTWGVNGSYLGPTIRATNGENIRIKVTNGLSEASTLHWHGAHAPAAMDGGPHQMIDPGQTWAPEWTIDQPAATLWYHPHLHGTTAEHVYRGIAGMFLIDEAGGPVLPSDYGVDDVPIIVQDKLFDGDQLDSEGSVLSNTGVLGDEILVNGTPGPYLDVKTELVRLRLLNASNARIYDFVLDGGTMTLVGSDGGLLPAAQLVEHVMLSPGERAEVLVRVPAGQRAVLRSQKPDLGVDFFQSRFGGGDDELDILELRAAKQLTPSAPVPASLAPVPDFGEPLITRVFDMTSDSKINRREMDMSRIDESVTAGDTEVWVVTNSSGLIHNFHVHGAHFYLEDDPNRALKDTVYVRPDATLRLIVRFELTDPTTPYMYHCHLLKHEDKGMMGQFVVVKPGETAEVVARHHH